MAAELQETVVNEGEADWKEVLEISRYAGLKAETEQVNAMIRHVLSISLPNGRNDHVVEKHVWSYCRSVSRVQMHFYSLHAVLVVFFASLYRIKCSANITI